MKKLLLHLGLVLALVLPLAAQDTAPVVPPAATTRLAADQLDQLLGPIALYPDALVALILPAATEPADVVLAARYLRDNGNPDEAASRAWDDSVTALVHYPEVLKWMDENLTWTKQLGEAFLDQPADVMNAVQRLRARAQASGALVDTPQQQVVVDAGEVSIIPAQPNVIYVPYYDPAVVYVSQPGYYADPFLTFSVGFPVGNWLSFDCDWGHHTIWTAERHWNWQAHRDWRHPIFPGRPGYVSDPNRHPWKPAPNYPRLPRSSFYQANMAIARPTPVIRSSQSPPFAHQDGRQWHGNEQSRADGRSDHPSNFSRLNQTPPQVPATVNAAPNPTVAAPAFANRRGGDAPHDFRDPGNHGVEYHGRPSYPPSVPGQPPAEHAIVPPRQAPYMATPPPSRAYTAPATPPPQARAAPPPPPPAAPAQPASEEEKRRWNGDNGRRAAPN